MATTMGPSKSNWPSCCSGFLKLSMLQEHLQPFKDNLLSSSQFWTLSAGGWRKCLPESCTVLVFGLVAFPDQSGHHESDCVCVCVCVRVCFLPLEGCEGRADKEHGEKRLKLKRIRAKFDATSVQLVCSSLEAFLLTIEVLSYSWTSLVTIVLGSVLAYNGSIFCSTIEDFLVCNGTVCLSTSKDYKQKEAPTVSKHTSLICHCGCKNTLLIRKQILHVTNM